jgi:hypothetical protein
MLNAKKARALFAKLSASERESEEYGLKENSHTIEIENPQRVRCIKWSRNPSTAIQWEENAHVQD